VGRKLVLVILAMTVAAVSGGPAQAKGKLSMNAPRSIATGHAVTVTVTTAERLPGLRLVIVAPKVSVMDVVAATTQSGAATSPRTIEMPRDGFAVLMMRTGKSRWTARVTFARPGTWRLVIPNWNLNGYAMPLPLVKSIHVAAP
jgi:hypothetical protein